jgi:(acyl-carrier-protein) S-malonyltransferase
MLCDLAVRFAEVVETFAQADQLLKNKLEKSLSTYIFPTPVFSKEEVLLQKEVLTDTKIAQPAMGATDMAALSLIKALGIKADMMAGHSYGEYVALCAAGYYDFENLMAISAERGEILAPADNNGSSSAGTMAAVSCSPDELAAYLPNKSNNITLANYNSPKQIVIAGAVNDIEQAIESLQNQDIVARRIAVSQAFHTPGMKRQPINLQLYCRNRISAR